MIFKVYPCSDKIGLQTSNISACGAADAPTTIVYSSFPPQEVKDAGKTIINDNKANSFLIYIFSFIY